MDRFTLFCPQCDTFIHTADFCAQCQWQRPPAVDLGQAVGEPLPLGRAVYGPPLTRGGKIWYAAPPTEKDAAGELLAIQQNGRLIQRFSLTDLAPEAGIPVALGLGDGGQHLLVGLLDYALNQGGAAKSLLALDPVSGEVAWELPTQSRELGTPVVADGYACFAGVTQDAVYTLHLASRRLTHFSLKVDSRFQPALTGGVIILISGSFIGPSYVLGLEARTGQELWRKEAARGFGQPVAAKGVVYMPWGRTIVAFDARSGEEIWQYGQLRPTSLGAATALLLAYDNWLLVPGGAGDPQKNGYALHALHAPSGQRRWLFEVPRAGSGHHILVPPVILEDCAIVGERQGEVYALDLASGEMQWQASLPRRLAAPPLADGATLLLPSRDGFLYRLRWQPTMARPPLPPQVYADRHEWELAAAAHLLAETPDYRAAANCLLRAAQWARARQLFNLAADPIGEAEALARLGRYEEAVAVYPADEISPQQKAEWLIQAGRHGEAADLYASLAKQLEEHESTYQKAWQDAAETYERAKRPLKAMEAYKKAGDQEAVDRLADTLDLSLLDKAWGLAGWRILVDRYKRSGHLAPAADLLEENEDWAEAIALHRQAKNWGRVRELSRQLQDWGGEAAACEKLAEQGGMDGTERSGQEWWLAAGQLYADHQQWPDAERCFTAARHYEWWAAALAAQGRLVEAAELLCAAESRNYAAAADYFWQAAEAAVAQKQAWEVFNPEAAALFEEAEKYYHWTGNTSRLLQARQEADRCRKRPRPLLGNAHIAAPFQQGSIAAVEIPLRNTGFAPAMQVQLFAYGLALKRPRREDAFPVGDPVAVLPPQTEQILVINLEPQQHSSEETPIQFNFFLRYGDGGEKRETERFGFATAVFPSYVDMVKEMTARGSSGSMTLNMSIGGNMFVPGGNMEVGAVINRSTTSSDSLTRPAPTGIKFPQLRSESEPLPLITSSITTTSSALVWVERCPHCGAWAGGRVAYCKDCGKPVQPVS